MWIRNVLSGQIDRFFQSDSGERERILDVFLLIDACKLK